jgi:RND family efflux transporter MFP subunit
VIHTKLGDSVAPGDPLCEIDSVELGNAVSDFLKARAVAQAAEETRDKTRRLYEARLATRQQILDGAVAIAEAIFAREKDLRDRELTTLRPYLEAEKALKEAKFTRERDMTGLRAERDSRLLELEVTLRTAQVELNTAENRLHIYGFTHEELASLKDEQGVNVGRYVIRSPVSGVITARHITLNEFVDTSTELFEIDDLSRSWIVASVYEKDLARIVRGQQAAIRLEAFPNVTFRGAVSYVSHSVDTSTRAARVRVEVDNEPIPQWKEPFPIRPGMFGVAELVLGFVEVPVAVPIGAVVREGEELYVFVRESELVFERRDVGVGRQSRERAEVVSGLEPGESVVTAGTFILKSMLHKGELGGGHEH